MATLTSIISFFHQPMKVACDRKCTKAWGINNRPKVVFSGNLDDYAFLADGELGDAPVNPGTYEGEDAKPLSSNEFPNKWCVRECERCARSAPGKEREPLLLTNWSRRVYNQPWKHAEP